MGNIYEQQYLQYLENLGYEQAPNSSRTKSCGRHFIMDSVKGCGDYWVYTKGDRFGIGIYETKFFCDQPVDYDPAPILFLVKTRVLNNGKHWRPGDLSVESIYGHVGSETKYKMKLSEGVHVHCICLSLAESFADEILKRNRVGNLEQLKSAINRFSTGNMVPEISETFRQICGFQPSEEIAGMYYEGKILELVSLVLQWDENCRRRAEQRITNSDLANLEALTVYLGNHFTETASLNDLARRARMSKSKLSNLFKQVYQSTITDYLHNLRLQRAKELLLDSDLKIAAIAGEVGYKLHGSFSEVFKQHTGFTPHEYRQMKYQ